MKKLYFLFFSLLTFSSFSQDYVISPSNYAFSDIQLGGYNILNIDLVHDNTTNDSIEVQWELIEKIAPTPAQGWDFSYCDYNQCYLANATGGTMKKFGPNENGFIKVTLLANTEGWGTFKFKTYKTGDEANADTLTFVFHAILGVDDIELGQNVQVFPNPSTDGSINVKNVLPGSTITVTNALGQQVASEFTNEEFIKMENMELRNGVYFVRLSRNSKVYATRKLIVR